MNRKLRTALIASIRAHALPPFTEITLSKLLTDVRKLLEELNQTSNYRMLKLFCDWAVHAKLSGKKVQKLLSEMNDFYDANLGPNREAESTLLRKRMSQMLQDFVTLQGFKNELNEFLKVAGVDTPHVLDKNSWAEFEDTYCKIVGDCMLVYTDKKKPLKHFDSAIINIEPLEWNPARLQYDPLTVRTGIQWR